MITTEDFEAIAREVSNIIEPSAVLRQYHRFLRIIRENPNQDARSFILQNLPSATDVLISNVISNLPSPLANASSSIQAYVKHRKYTVSDSVQGWFISRSAYDDISDFVDTAVPVKQLFDSLCDIYRFPSDRMTYCEVIKLLGGLVKKESHHPCCTETEYLATSPEKAKDLVLSSLCASLRIDLNEATLLSLENGANKLSVSPRRLQDWISSHETDTWYGSGFVAKVTVKRLYSAWKKVIPLNEQSVYDLFPDIPPLIIKPLVACISKSELANAHLLLPGTFPQQGDGVFAANKKEACLAIKSVLDIEPFIPIKLVSVLTGIKDSEIAAYREAGTIKSTDTPDGAKVTYSELNRHLETLHSFVSMDEVVQKVVTLESSRFRLKAFNHKTALINFCDDNSWWNLFRESSDDYLITSPVFGKVLKKSEEPDFCEHIRLFLKCFGKNPSDILDLVIHENEKRYPKSSALLVDFFNGLEAVPPCAWEMTDMLFFLLSKQHAEITDLSRDKLEGILTDFQRDCSMACCSLLRQFLANQNVFRVHLTFSTSGYKRDVSAYSLDSYALINYVCLNPEAWEKENLISKAVNSPEYANLWLFVTCLCFSSIRGTDFPRLPPPWLPDSPSETLANISASSGSITESESVLRKARDVTVAFLTKIEALSMTPQKTKKSSDISPICFHIPQNCMDAFGIVLSIAAAHFYIARQKGSHSQGHQRLDGFIIPSYDKTACWNFFGPKFVKACDNQAFFPLRANKAFMQSREYEYSQQEDASPYVAYALASAIRSHKGGYGQLSETTAIYLRDACFSGINPEFVAKQMLERGTCSWVVDRVFTTCFGKQYSNLTIAGKTRVIKAANIDAFELVSIKDLIQRDQDEVANEISLVLSSPDAAKAFLDRFLSGQATGKTQTSDCALRACGRSCIYKSRLHCYGCIFEIRSKVSFVHYLLEYKRINDLLQNRSLTEKERLKYKFLVKKSLSIVSEMLTYIDSSANDSEVELYYKLYELMRGETTGGIIECS